MSSFEETILLNSNTKNFYLDKGVIVLCLGHTRGAYMRFLYGEQIIAAPWWDSRTLSCLFEQVEE